RTSHLSRRLAAVFSQRPPNPNPNYAAICHIRISRDPCSPIALAANQSVATWQCVFDEDENEVYVKQEEIQCVSCLLVAIYVSEGNAMADSRSNCNGIEGGVVVSRGERGGGGGGKGGGNGGKGSNKGQSSRKRKENAAAAVTAAANSTNPLTPGTNHGSSNSSGANDVLIGPNAASMLASGCLNNNNNNLNSNSNHSSNGSASTNNPTTAIATTTTTAMTANSCSSNNLSTGGSINSHQSSLDNGDSVHSSLGGCTGGRTEGSTPTESISSVSLDDDAPSSGTTGHNPHSSHSVAHSTNSANSPPNSPQSPPTPGHRRGSGSGSSSGIGQPAMVGVSGRSTQSSCTQGGQGVTTSTPPRASPPLSSGGHVRSANTSMHGKTEIEQLNQQQQRQQRGASKEKGDGDTGAKTTNKECKDDFIKESRAALTIPSDKSSTCSSNSTGKGPRSLGKLEKDLSRQISTLTRHAPQ
ncbi:hypothetical protein BIW11_10358, partial [Tropilaelaps mercedesae]